MPRLPLLFAAASALTLAACATQPVPPAAATAAAVPQDDTTTYGLYLAGHAARDAGALDVAADYLGRASLSEGGPPYLRRKAFTAALLAGDVTRAAALAPDAPADGDEDDSAAALRRLGVLVQGVEAMAQGRYKDAVALLDGPGVGYPHRAAALLLAPWAEAGAGAYANAVNAVPVGNDPLAQFVARLNQAQLFERAGRNGEAEAVYKQLLTNGDTAGIVSVAYGVFLERRGRLNDAQALYRAALARNIGDPALGGALARASRHGQAPSLPTIRQSAAEALILPAARAMSEKQNEVALGYLRLALRLNPNHDEAWVLVGDLLAVAGDAAGARAAYSHPKLGSPRYQSARDKLAWSYQNGGQGDEALRLARETALAMPGSRQAKTTLAELLRENNDYEESATVLTQMIEQPGAQPDWRLYYLRASAYDGAGDWTKEEADLQTALKLRPDSPTLLNYLGYAWIDRGEHLQDALAMIQRAAVVEPQSGEVMDSLGWAYYRLGDYPSAVAKLEEAASLEAADADVNNHLGDAYWRVGRKIEAQFQWRRVLSLEPRDTLRAQVQAKLASPLGPDAPTPPPAATPAPPPADPAPAVAAKAS